MQLSEAAELVSAETAEAAKRLGRTRRCETVEDVLLLSLEDVCAGAALSGGTAMAAAVVAELSALILRPIATAAEMLLPSANPRAPLMLGDAVVDAALPSALLFAPGTVVEVAGEAASGKTHFAMQLCARSLVAFGGSSSAVFVQTEAPFNDSRFSEICRGALLEEGEEERLLSRLCVKNAVHMRPNQVPALLVQIEELCGESDVRLVVFDSVAALYRSEFGAACEDLRVRAEMLWELGHKLHRIASRGVCVVVLNQVTDFVADDFPAAATATTSVDGQQTHADCNAGTELSPRLLSRDVRPTLGLGWSNCINARLLLSRTSLELGPPTVGVVRKMQVVFSPCAPQSTTFFHIAADGIHGIHDADLVSN